MTLDPAPGSASGLVVCVGLPSDQIIEIAHLLRGRATVLATPDAEGARAVLANPNPAPAQHPGPLPGTAGRGRGETPGRFTNPGPPDEPGYGRHMPDHPGEPGNEGLPSRPPLDLVPVALSTASDAAATAPGRRFRPTTGVLAQVAPATRWAAGGRRAGRPAASSGVVPTSGAVPVVTGAIPMVAPPTPEPLVAGPLLVDLAGREVTARGRRVYLSAREFDLLATLALEAGRVWSFAELTAQVWQLPYLGDSDPVTSAVKRLRKRLAPVRDVEVASVRGVGYRLTVQG
ncbi:winged helix-turn-helix domain-containing protein [Promicromonospora sp. MS192]|uniref:winged helix-turn-helix domain-containing protein n=1 Tax=Promicromonospora sp. MS192 TaxID=3412684 RepID=UPI003C2C236B